ncbi:probable sarcosine oxidase [Aristolochia californica]|uniref:probable sarcosine oxidase n=1 Tax=Aristolochia californica TaxID=171875 RepID=UPI0035E25646
MEDSSEEFDVVVVGGGIMGSCTAYELAKRELKVLLLEQFDLLHHRGSSHGESRTIRVTYPEEYYAALVLQAWRLWEEAESEIGYRVLTRTPHLDIGPAGNKSLQAVIAGCRSNSIPHRVLDSTQIGDHFSGLFHLPESWIGVYNEQGGVIRATKALSMFQTLALKRGAVLRDHMEVKEIKKDELRGGISLSMANGEKIWGKKCVVTIGAWTKELVKTVRGTVLPIQPLHTTICYWRIKEGMEECFSAGGGFPTFASYGDPYIYGTPSLEFPGLIKVAVHGGYPCDPDRRTWATDMDCVKRSICPWIEGRFAGGVKSTEPVVIQSCMYSMTPDEDFVIDFLGGELGKEVVLAGGFSGHGFKMAPVVGRILADLAAGGEAPGFDLRYFRLGRFEENPKGNPKEHEDQVGAQLPP